jgi:hypothetical protein
MKTMATVALLAAGSSLLRRAFSFDQFIQVVVFAGWDCFEIKYNIP